MQPVHEVIRSIDESVGNISAQASTLLHAGSEAGEDLEKALHGLGKPGKRDNPDDADTAATKRSHKAKKPKLKGQPAITTMFRNFSGEYVMRSKSFNLLCLDLIGHTCSLEQVQVVLWAGRWWNMIGEATNQPHRSIIVTLCIHDEAATCCFKNNQQLSKVEKNSGYTFFPLPALAQRGAPGPAGCRQLPPVRSTKPAASDRRVRHFGGRVTAIHKMK